MAKIILLNGSPHPQGCTATALDEMIRIFDSENIETELIHVGNKAFAAARETIGYPEVESGIFTSFPDGK